jgi:CBS domain-containing protein
MTLHDILRNKGTNVFTIAPEATLADVARALADHNIGSLLVCEPVDGSGERLLGIITERDLVRACAKNPTTPLGRLKVADVMVRDLITVSPADSVEDTMGLMTERRIRHLPVVEDGRLAGMISIGDVVKAQHDSLTMENHYLKSYIRG